MKTFALAVLALWLCGSATTSYGADADNNGVDDDDEQELIELFCPSLVLDGRDVAGGVQICPEPVQIVTNHLYGNGFTYPIWEDYIGSILLYPQYPDITGMDISWIEFRNNYYFQQIEASCAWADQAFFSYHFDFGGFGPGCTEPNSRGDNDQPAGWRNVYVNGNQWSSPGAVFPHTVYAHIYQLDGSPIQTIVIQYWLFYPFNDWVTDHEGDWEHIEVHIVGNSTTNAQLQGVVYYFHERFKVCSQPQVLYPNEDFDCYVTDGTHPVVFVGGWGEYDVAGDHGQGPGSHGSYPIYGLWEDVVDNGPLAIDDNLDGHGLYIPWRAFVDEDKSDEDGVVLIKNPSSYNFSVHPEKSWLKADLRWGHPFVHGFWDNPPFTWDHNDAPRGPYHKAEWESFGGDFAYYSGSASEYPWASDANWVPPYTFAITSPIDGSSVSDVVTVSGVVSFADSLVIEYGQGTSPSSWLRTGTVLADFPGPISGTGAFGTWNTGVAPAGTYTVRVRSFDGSSEHVLNKTVTVTHRGTTVGAGGLYTTIQQGIDWAQMGDTVRVANGTYAGSIVLKQTVQLIAAVSAAEIVGIGNNSVLTATGHQYPATVDGFTIRHSPSDLGPGTYGVRVIDSPVVLRNCIIRDTRADLGAGIYATGASNVRLEHCEIRDTNYGGGLVIAATVSGRPSVTATDCEFRENLHPIASFASHGAVALLYSPTKPLMPTDPIPSFERCLFISNKAGRGGAAVKLEYAGTPTITFKECVFAGNLCDAGPSAAVYCEGANVRLEKCTFAGNQCDNCSGAMGGVALEAGGSAVIDRCIFASNEGPGAYAVSLPASMVASSTVMYGNGTFAGAPTDADWVSIGQEIISENPAFCDAANGDYHLYAFSPAAKGPHFAERVGALDVGCVPAATITASIANYPFPNGNPLNVIPACPKDDAARLVVLVNLLDAEMTRDVGANEIRLDLSDFSAKVFDGDAVPLGADGPATGGQNGNGYATSIAHGGFGGHGTGLIDVLLNGVSLGPKILVNIRTPDAQEPYGTVNTQDFAGFGAAYPSPTKPLVEYFDFNGDAKIDVLDFTWFGSHYPHASPYSSLNGPAEVVESAAHVALQFTDEYVTPLERRLYADVNLANVGGIRVCVFSMYSNRQDLTFAEWQPADQTIGQVLFTPAVRDGQNELFFGILAADDFTGSASHLGRLVFDVAGNSPIDIGNDQFILTVGDIQIGGGSSGYAAQMSGVFGRALDPSINKVFHNGLEQNYPNPFNPQTTIAFSIKDAARVKLTIYDVAGRRVRDLVDEHRGRGAYRVSWNGQDDRGAPVASGVYFYKLTAGSFTDTKKMTILK